MKQDKDTKTSDKKAPGANQPDENFEPENTDNAIRTGSSDEAGSPGSGAGKADSPTEVNDDQYAGSAPIGTGAPAVPDSGNDPVSRKKEPVANNKEKIAGKAKAEESLQKTGGPEAPSAAAAAAEANGDRPDDSAEITGTHQAADQFSGSTEPAAGDPDSSTLPAGKFPKRRKSWMRWLKWLFVLALIAGLIIGSIVVWEKYGIEYVRNILEIPVRGVSVKPAEPVVIHTPAPENWREPFSALETRLESRLAQVAGANRGLEAGVQNELADMQVRLNSYGERIRALSTTTREDWLLAEAEYLLRLAGQRLLTERQTKNALALMETADLILRDLNDPDLFPVRKVLADDITALRMAGVIDREGLYLRLDSLAGSVDQLTPLHNHETNEVEEAAPGAPDSPPAWDEQLLGNVRSAFRDMINLVRIQRRDMPLEPLLSVEQEMNLRYNIRVMLEQAQLALLREEQTIYDTSLAKAEQWVERHFVPNVASQAVLGELRKMRQESVVQPLPSVTGSLSALHDYIALWHNRYPVKVLESEQ